MSRKYKILVAGFNPAWQKTLLFHKFEPYHINRAVSVEYGASGKGINFARATKIWDIAEPCILQFLGGMTGDMIRTELASENLHDISVDSRFDTRTCTTLISEDGASPMTELIEPSHTVPSEAVTKMSACFRENMPFYDALAICGTFPPGVPDTFYADMVTLAKAHGKFVLLDSFMNVEKTLEAGVDLLKINKDELSLISGLEDMQKAVYNVMRRFPLRYLAITDGAESACFSDGKTIKRITVPHVEKVMSALGSGDTCSAVMLSEIVDGSGVDEAFRRGLAAASANCLTRQPAVFNRLTALKMLDESIIDII